MNNTRRKFIEKVILNISTIREEIEDITSEELEAYDNMPEGIQESERGNNIYENISDLEDISSNIDEIIATLQDIIER